MAFLQETTDTHPLKEFSEGSLSLPQKTDIILSPKPLYILLKYLQPTPLISI
jgi:hypothetical protein